MKKTLVLLLSMIFLLICNVMAFYSKDREKDVLELSPMLYQEKKIEKSDNNFNTKSLYKFNNLTSNKKDNGKIVFIYDFLIDENYLINDVKYFSLEKSLVENYNSLKYIYKYASNLPIILSIKAPIFDFIMDEISYDDKKLYKEKTKLDDYIDKFLFQKFNLEDQKSILNNLKIFPRNNNLFVLESKNVVNFYNIYKKLNINYEILNSTDNLVSTAYINSLNIMQYFYLEAIVFYNILWLDENSLSDKKVMKILNDEDYIIGMDDLEYIKNLKNNNFREAMNFFLNLPRNWTYLVYPYYEPRFDILTSNSLNKYFLNFNFNIDLYTDASWHVAKSFKTINNFYMRFDKKFIEHKYPIGIITSLDYIDKNIQKTLAVRDYEVVVNKGNYIEYFPIILKNSATNKNICLFFENIEFDKVYTEDADLFVKNFLKKLTFYKEKKIPAIFTINKEKLLNLGLKETEYFYERLFSEIYKKKNLAFVSFDTLKEDLISDKGKENNNKIDLNEQDFIIQNEQISYRLSNEVFNNYWFAIKLVRTELDNKKNNKEIAIDSYMEHLSNLYKIESNLFLNFFLFDEIRNTNLKKYFKDFFYKIYAELNIDVNFILSKNNLLKGDSKKEEVKEFSKIYFHEEKEAFTIEDSLNDDYGDGNYIYPKNKNIKKGDLDIKNFYVEKKENEILFKIYFKKSNVLTDPIRNKQIDIYIDTDTLENSGSLNLFDNRNAFFDKFGFEYAISINNDDVNLFIYQDGAIKFLESLFMDVNYDENSITIGCPINFFEGIDIFYCGYSVMTFGYDDIKKSIIKVNSNFSNNLFSGRTDLFQSNIIDIILPNGEDQKKLLGARSEISKLPFIYPKKREV